MTIRLSVALLFLACAQFVCANDVSINGDLQVLGALSVAHIGSSSLTVNGSIAVSDEVKTQFLTATSAKIGVLQTDELYSPSGNLHLAGGLSMKRDGVEPALLEVGSLETATLTVHGQRQWALVHHHDFEADGHGWADAATGAFIELSEGGYLGGHCKTGAGTTVRRRFDLPPHTQLRVGARVHFVDGWEGETAFLQVDGAYAWVDTARAHPNGLNLAGGPQPDARFGVPVDAVVAHTAPSVLLEIGSTLDEHACDESYGVDDVQIHVR